MMDGVPPKEIFDILNQNRYSALDIQDGEAKRVQISQVKSEFLE